MRDLKGHILNMYRCHDHGSYDGSRAPRGSCEDCWYLYNKLHDLPEGNREARSNLDSEVRLTRFLPDMVGYGDTLESLGLEKGNNVYDDVESIGKHVEGFQPISMGLDLSLRATGFAVICRINSARWFVVHDEFGIKLSQDADKESSMNRLLSIAKSGINLYNTCKVSGESQGRFDVSLEDHAHRARGNKGTQLRELHGVVKSQFYLSTGTVPEPINISSARSEVFNHGRPSGDTKGALRRGLEGTGQTWVDQCSDNEIDAWTVAACKLKNSDLFLKERI